MAAQSPAAVGKARESSLQVKGARQFNLVPRDLSEKRDNFKAGLDAWLFTLPDADCPRVVVRTQASCAHAHGIPVSMLTKLW